MLKELESADLGSSRMIRDHFLPSLFPYCSRPAVRSRAVPSWDLPTLRAFLPQISVDSPGMLCLVGTQVALGRSSPSKMPVR